jgi:hypothetical protein
MQYGSILRHFPTRLAGLRDCLKITYFTQFLCCQKNLILKILGVFLKVKFFFRLELDQTKQFSNSLLDGYLTQLLNTFGLYM